ncbi:hypothetical protein [Escherichia coli]
MAASSSSKLTGISVQ